MYNESLEIKSIQPFIVLESQKFYQHYLTDYGISHFYSFQGNSNGDTVVPFIADGCSNIIFAYKKDGVKSTFIGNTVEQIPFTIEKGVEYFGIRFQPGENPCFNNLVVKDLVGKEIDLCEFSNMQELCDKMSRERNFYSRMCAFMNEYNKFINREVSVQHQLYRQFIRVIVSRKGLLKISELVVLTGYSARYINQIFEEISGMSAKQFCNIVKLQFLLNDIDNSNMDSFSKLASDYNFYDMAHFIHNFKAYTGHTPKDYASCIKTKEYQKKVVNI